MAAAKLRKANPTNAGSIDTFIALAANYVKLAVAAFKVAGPGHEAAFSEAIQAFT